MPIVIGRQDVQITYQSFHVQRQPAQFANLTCELQVKMLWFSNDTEEGSFSSPLRVSFECFCRNARRSLVVINHSRHDAARLS